MFLWTKKCNFKNPDEKLSTKGRKTFSQCPKAVGKTEVFTKIFSSSKYC